MKRLLVIFCLFMSTLKAQDEYERYALLRDGINESELIYYFSPANQVNYPIVVLCEGSYCYGEPLKSVLGKLKKFSSILQECHVGMLCLEKWGVDGDFIDETVFHEHNTITQRIQDHKQVVDHLSVVKPVGWNGKLIFFGGSEGGDLVTALTMHYRASVIATVIFAGIGLRSRQDEIWDHMQSNLKNISWYEQWVFWWHGILQDRNQFDEQVRLMIQNPDVAQWWYGQTYKYWADALTRPRETLSAEFYNLSTPIFISIGTADSFITSSDELVEKMKQHQMQIAYYRLEDIPHDITNCAPEIFDVAASWLQKIIQEG